MAEKDKEEIIFKIGEQAIPSLPDVKDETKFDVKYPLIEPFANAHIFWDSKNNELIYNIEEPVLNEREKKILSMLEEGIAELINISFLNLKTIDVVIEYLEKNIKVLLSEFGIKLSRESFLKLMYYIYRDFVGLNEIEPLMKDYFIEDIECNGAGTPVYIVHRKYRNLRTNIIYNEAGKLTNFVEKLAQKCGKYISYASPILDGSLPDGSRCNATYTQEISSRGPTFCFADGYLQLGDGEVIKIQKLFERCKSNFESKVENGTEVVEINNMSCCGVDENNLNQFNSKLKSIIKLQPPKKLVNVTFNDGAEIITTTNHLFHIADANLILKEADKLEEGMFVPIPSKIEVEGYLQSINVTNLIRELSYSHRICIVSNTKVKELVNNMISNFKNNYRDYRQKMAQEYGVHNSYFYELISRGHSISFKVLDKMCNTIPNLKESNFGDLSVVFYGGGKPIKVPTEVDEDLAYLAGAIISDGHLSESGIDIFCSEKGFRKAVTSRLIKKFGRAETYYNGMRVYLSSLFVSYFFNKIFDIPYGKKHDIVKVPKIIFKSDNRVVASFIKGLFDGDGTCKSGLSYKTNSKQLAEELTYLLARLGIYSKILSKDNQYRILIPSVYEEIYAKKIGFENEYKFKSLIQLSGKKDEIRSFINHGRVPAKPFLELMKNVGLSKKKVIELCGVDYSRLIYYDSLSKPFAKQIISILESEICRNDIKVHNLDYLKWLVNSNQEFIKIQSVNIFDNVNNIPVYDIELEPCKFFVAGNKPMNVFDTIRKFSHIPWSPIKMMEFRTVSPELLAYLWILIENEANIMVIGGTGAGKTVMLNTLAFFIPPQARIVSIEDTRELLLLHENWLPSVARTGIGIGEEGRRGEIDLFTLLKESFRQRPDYVIVGEVRGAEAYVLFQGMASGHPSMGTMHAEDVGTMIRRLETQPINLSPSLVESMDAVCVMGHAKVGGVDVRRLREVDEIISVSGMAGVAKLNTPFIWDPRTDNFYFKTDSKIFDKIVAHKGISRKRLNDEFSVRTRLLLEMYKRKIFEYKEVQEVITAYYKNPMQVLKRFGIIK